jgi:hypothetical protein
MTSSSEGGPGTVPCDHCGTLLEVPRYDNVPPWVEAAESGTYHSESRCRDVLKGRLAAALASERDAVQHASESLALLQRGAEIYEDDAKLIDTTIAALGVHGRQSIVPFIQGLFQRAKDSEASENVLDVALATMEKERDEAVKSLQFLLSAEVCGSCGESACTLDSVDPTIRCASCGADRMACSKCAAATAEKERTLSSLRALATAVLNYLSDGGQNGFSLTVARRVRGANSDRRSTMTDALVLATDITGPLTS